MINLEVTEEAKNSLYYERFHHPHPRIQLKMEVLWLKSQKIPDNARYQKCKAVEELAFYLSKELLYLPSYTKSCLKSIG
jgi:hypothetical protein